MFHSIPWFVRMSNVTCHQTVTQAATVAMPCMWSPSDLCPALEFHFWMGTYKLLAFNSDFTWLHTIAIGLVLWFYSVCQPGVPVAKNMVGGRVPIPPPFQPPASSPCHACFVAMTDLGFISSREVACVSMVQYQSHVLDLLFYNSSSAAAAPVGVPHELEQLTCAKLWCQHSSRSAMRWTWLAYMYDC